VRSSLSSRSGALAAGSVVCLVLLAGCGSGGSKGGSSGATGPSTTGKAQPTTATAQVPTSCSAVPLSVLDPFLPGAKLALALGPVPHGISCEFSNSTATSIVILNIGSGGTAASFAQLRATSAGGGRTATSVSGLGTDAFSISKGGKVAGVDAIDSHGVIFSVASSLTLDQDEQLLTQLMSLY
jgi:hypothetical protein